MSKFIVGLDVGSSQIKAAIAEQKNQNEFVLKDLKRFPSMGMRRGMIDNFSDAAQSIGRALQEINEDYPRSIRNLILSVGSEKVNIQTSKGVVAVSRADDEIYQDDIKRVTQSSQAINISPNRIILHPLTQEFIVDGEEGIRDPLGMTGKRLEANSLIIDDFAPAVNNLTKCIEDLGGGVLDVIFSPLASAEATLTKNQKELGVVLIDIGYGKTSIAIYEEQKLLHAAVVPIGSGHISNDLAIGLKIPVDVAEKIKLSFGSASAKKALKKDSIDLNKIDERAQGNASKKFIAQIIEARLTEIFEYVNEEMKKVDRENQLPAGAVLLGGGSKLPGLIDLAKEKLGFSVQLANPNLNFLQPDSAEISIEAEQIDFIPVIGLLLYNQLQYSPQSRIPGQAGSWLRQVLKYFIP
ncbi:MAG: cell division protein FtsA [Candidatus Harrisonbacteria bacterium CG10_big_fil_rev_8_21_14_0_10_44_23]|uniref:Cell division protein FtsA n=1 Tax=Candidatus Harrisonbacteria bacterium CG10_big_fil_rev_8_21_14_0_10_44_23 TaxID=1974585 RepID=A0A2H0USB0_9BACT|nr:MAG: cell division protein FtsA [Candidatus Harrisonbacteria bacterium CG10_big_fil_rev_8_21_14_0_10_44_23]